MKPGWVRDGLAGRRLLPDDPPGTWSVLLFICDLVLEGGIVIEDNEKDVS